MSMFIALRPFLATLLVLSIARLPVLPVTLSQERGKEAGNSALASGNDILVTFHVSVVDKKGNAVTDLTPADFRAVQDNTDLHVDSVIYDRSAGVSLSLLVDVSGSHRADRDRAKEFAAMQGFLNSALRPNDTATVVAVGESSIVVAGPTRDSNALAAALDTVSKQKPYGATAIYDAIFTLARANSSASSVRNAFVIVSDFEDNLSRRRIKEAIREAQKTNTAIFTIVYSNEPGPLRYHAVHGEGGRVARNLSQETGGASFIAESVKELTAALREITTYLQNFYTISLRVPITRPGGTFGEIKLATLRKGAAILAPRGYVIPGS